MNLINMKTGARVTSSSSKHDAVLNRYNEEDPNYRVASRLEYELAGLLFIYGSDMVSTVLSNLIDEMKEVAQ